MSLVVDFLVLLLGIALCNSIRAEPTTDLHILVIGGPMGANCHAYRFNSSPGVYQFNQQGEEIPAKDPLVWSDCNGGSVWIPLGELLIKSKVYEKVVFFPVAVMDTDVNNWDRDTPSARKLAVAIQLAKTKYVSFDVVLYIQGSSDPDKPAHVYKQQLESLISRVRSLGVPAPWLIAEHSGCHQSGRQQIQQAQSEFVSNRFLKAYFAGPSTALITPEMWNADCQLNYSGQMQLAQLWFNAMRHKSEFVSRARKESLLGLFGQ